jgi:hypothetical protein
MNIKEALHLLADGISLVGSVRQEVHDAIEDHYGDAPAPAEPATAPADPPAGA